MDPKCHPELSQAKNETDLKAEQDEFFLSGSLNCVNLISPSSKNTTGTPSVAVLDEVIERSTSGTTIKAPSVPITKPTLKPVKIIKKPTIPDETADISQLKDVISHENDEKLSKMTLKEIEALQTELFESVPESFLDKLRTRH